MVSVSSQFLKQMFTSAGYGISLSPGTLKREQNPSLLVGKLEQSYRTKHQPLSSDLTAVVLLTSQQVYVSGETETADKHCSFLWNEGLWRCDDEVMSKAEATKWWEAEAIPLLFIWCKGKMSIVSGTSCFLNRVSLLLKRGCLSL